MKKRVRNLIIFSAGLLGIFLLLCATHYFWGIGIPCPLHSITGLYCPGCGAFRALYSLLMLDLSAAISYNLLFVLVLPFLLFWLGKAAWLYLQDKPAKSSRGELSLAIGLCVVGIVFGLLRNLPPFAFLAPGGLLL